MQAVITGHTSGIGKAIYEWATRKGWQVQGFSRSTGHPIEELEVQESILRSTAGADIFFNNTHAGFHQIDLAYKWFHQNYKFENKTMVTLGSRASDSVLTRLHPYSVEKKALDTAIKQMQSMPHNCRMIHLRFGYVDTPAVSNVTIAKLKTDDVIQALDWALSSSFYVREVFVATHDKKVTADL